MKKILLLAALLTLASPIFGEETLPRDLQKCPFGHEDIVMVPIGYGLPIDLGKRKKQEGKLPSSFEGGCVTADDSPKNAPGCPKCGFYYLRFLDQDWNKGEWTLRVSDRAELFKPLSPAVSDFPGLDEDSKNVEKSYSQSVDRRHRLMSESIGIRRKGKLTDAEALLKPWLLSKGIDPQMARRSERGIIWENDRFYIWVTKEGRILDFSVRHTLKSPSGS